MKRILGAILLTLILIFQFSGGHLLFHIQRARIKKEIKHQIKNGVPEDEMITFTIHKSKSTLQWINDHEFWHEGHMYDVVHQTNKGDSLFLQCINDDQETSLFASLDKVVNKRLNHPSNKKNIIKSLSYHYLKAHDTPIPVFSQIENPNSFTSDFSIKTWASPPDSPPPRFI